MTRARHHHLLIGLMTLVALLALLTTQVKAGGWAVITLDHLPEAPIANQPFEVSFMVRQHGLRPMANLTPQLIATHVESGETVEATAQALADTGHYLATLTLPQAGQWRWSIQAFTMNIAMPDLEVLAGSSNHETETQAWPIWLGMGGFMGMVGSTLLWWRKRVWGTTLIVLTAGSIGTMGIAMTMNHQAPMAEKSPWVNESDLGDRLFVAKGCITCHYHDAVETKTVSLHIGPNLTHFTTSPEYLRLWLKDPAAVKPTTLMPNLHLSETEIEALIPLWAPSPAQASK